MAIRMTSQAIAIITEAGQKPSNSLKQSWMSTIPRLGEAQIGSCRLWQACRGSALCRARKAGRAVGLSTGQDAKIVEFESLEFAKCLMPCQDSPYTRVVVIHVAQPPERNIPREICERVCR
jgi:hypothetical protein